MAKEREQRVARILYVEQQKTAKEISQLINVTEATLSKWINKLGWKDERNARLSSPALRAENIKQLINELSEQRLDASRELREAIESADLERTTDLRKQIAGIDDAVSKWNKTLQNIHKENQVSLATYLSVMEMIFDALEEYDEKLFYSTLDFQDKHLNEVSLRFR